MELPSDSFSSDEKIAPLTYHGLLGAAKKNGNSDSDCFVRKYMPEKLCSWGIK